MQDPSRTWSPWPHLEKIIISHWEEKRPKLFSRLLRMGILDKCLYLQARKLQKEIDLEVVRLRDLPGSPSVSHLLNLSEDRIMRRWLDLPQRDGEPSDSERG